MTERYMLGYSPVTDTIYIGKRLKDRNGMKVISKDKEDATCEVLNVLMAMTENGVKRIEFGYKDSIYKLCISRVECEMNDTGEDE